ncbi:MAG TPA: helix-turn-helix transcriptional regulator, partial [Gammaproteobacteria bacterium]|nr:helix-turn-helix transcriptional regulator [Gammaproteobacteria bacterium]
VPQPIGPRIRVARENAGLALSEAARKLGVTEATLEAWESGEEEPRANRLQMLAGLLNVSLPWFLEGREDEYMAARPDAEDDALRAELAEIRVRLEEIRLLVASAENRLASRGR